MNKNNITSAIPNKETIRQTYESYNPILQEIMHRIEDKLKKTINLASMPTYKSRIKSFNSYYRKVLRLKPEEAGCGGRLIELTDMMGIRVICAFMEDLRNVENQIKQNFDVKEVEYKGSRDNFKEFGYESIHVLVSIPEDCFPLDVSLNLPENLVCEIQIRTILQDAWAEVEHELIYKTEFTPFDMPLRRKLASINASLSLADTIFQEIRDYQKKLQLETAARRESFYAKVDENTNTEKNTLPAEKNIARINPFQRGTIDDILLEAIHAHNSGEMENAISLYTQILESQPEPSEQVLSVVYKHRGMAFFASNDFNNALNDFNLSVKYDPKNFRSYYYIGIVYCVLEDFEKAVENFTKSLSINEFQSHARYRRAIAYSKIGEDSKALEDVYSAEALGLKDNDLQFLKQKLLKKLDMTM